MTYRRAPFTSPWKGWDDSSPSLVLDPTAFKEIINWMIVKNRLSPAPQFNNFRAPPTGAGATIWGARSFIDATGAYHTVLFSELQAYYLRPDGTYDAIPAVWFWPQSQPFAMEVYQNQLFFSGGLAVLRYISGDNAVYLAGDAFGACSFLGKLDGKLLMLNTVENGVTWPRRVRWCALNNPLEWDPSVDFTAGVVDISEVEDAINGYSTIGNNGFVYRTNGMTVFTPTGIGFKPFQIENFSNGPKGIGVYTAFTLANYGTFSVFRAQPDIYYFDGSSPQPIGGKAKKSILKDIDGASSNCNSSIIGSLGKGVDYLSYWLMCPQNNDTSTSLWVYHFDSTSWVNFQLPYGPVRCLDTIATS